MGSFKTAAINVGTTATKLTTFSDIPAGSPSDFDAIVYNNGAATVYVGGSDVTASNGIPLATGLSLSVRVESDLYGIVASGTVECRVGSMGVS